MRHLVFTGLGIGFLLMGVALYLLTLRKPKETGATLTKAQQREHAAMVEETRKMRIAAGCVAVLGGALVILSFL